MESDSSRPPVESLNRALDALKADLERRPDYLRSDPAELGKIRRDLMTQTVLLEEARREKDQLWAWCEGEIQSARAEIEMLRQEKLEILVWAEAAIEQARDHLQPAPQPPAGWVRRTLRSGSRPIGVGSVAGEPS